MNRPPPHVHDKEGVSGSSPEEGFRRSPCKEAASVVCVDTVMSLRERRGNIFVTPSALTRDSMDTDRSPRLQEFCHPAAATDLLR